MVKPEEFNENVGKVLNASLHVENLLDFFISNYFVKPQIDKTHFFNDILILKMNFERKIELFKDICKREKFNKEKVNSVVKSIKYIQGIRNKVAHGQSMATSLGDNVWHIYLKKRTSFTTQEDILELDKELMDKIDQERLDAVEGISKLYMKYVDNGTIDERPNGWKVI